MGEDAIFNRPLDATSLASKESPIQEVSAMSPSKDPSYSRPPTTTSFSSDSRASSETRGRPEENLRPTNSNSSLSQSTSSTTKSGGSGSKRLPRKLTKNRVNSETSLERLGNTAQSPAPASNGQQPQSPQLLPQQQERSSTERARSVLTKRVREEKT